MPDVNSVVTDQLVKLEEEVKAAESTNTALKAKVADLETKLAAGVFTDDQQKKLTELTQRLHALATP